MREWLTKSCTMRIMSSRAASAFCSRSNYMLINAVIMREWLTKSCTMRRMSSRAASAFCSRSNYMLIIINTVIMRQWLTKSCTMRRMSSRAASAFCSRPVMTITSALSESLSGIVTCTSWSWRILDTTVPRRPMILGWNRGSTDTSSLKLRNTYSQHTLLLCYLLCSSSRETVVFIHRSDTDGWATGRALDLYKAGCWFVGGDDLTGALHVVQLQLSIPPPSSSKIQNGQFETFWYRLTQIHLENGH